MIKEELTLRVTDLETKAIAFCREKDVPYPITKYLVAFATEVTKELEKKNKELKGEADSVLDNWCKGNDPCPHLKKRDEQLTKAKEIIEKLLEEEKNNIYWEMNGSDKSSYYEVRKQAEQFLKDSEVEK